MSVQILKTEQEFEKYVDLVYQYLPAGLVISIEKLCQLIRKNVDSGLWCDKGNQCYWVDTKYLGLKLHDLIAEEACHYVSGYSLDDDNAFDKAVAYGTFFPLDHVDCSQYISLVVDLKIGKLMDPVIRKKTCFIPESNGCYVEIGICDSLAEIEFESIKDRIRHDIEHTSSLFENEFQALDVAEFRKRTTEVLVSMGLAVCQDLYSYQEPKFRHLTEDEHSDFIRSLFTKAKKITNEEAQDTVDSKESCWIFEGFCSVTEVNEALILLQPNSLADLIPLATNIWVKSVYRDGLLTPELVLDSLWDEWEDINEEEYQCC